MKYFVLLMISMLIGPLAMSDHVCPTYSCELVVNPVTTPEPEPTPISTPQPIPEIISKCGPASIISDLDFENGFGESGNRLLSGSTAEIIDGGRASAKAAFFTVGRDKALCTRKYRAEFRPLPTIRYKWDDGKSYWIGVSYHPVDFSAKAYTLFQIHGPNEPSGSCDWAGNAITLSPKVTDGVLMYRLMVLQEGGNAGKGTNSNVDIVWEEPMIEGVWSDFVFNFTLSTKGQGFVKVWKDGAVIYDRQNMTNVNFNDECGKTIPKKLHTGPQVGIYGPSCRISKKGKPYTPGSHYRSIKVDNFRVAVGEDGYFLVTPNLEERCE